MTYYKASWSALGAALLVAACGGGDGNQAPAIQFTSMVSFGDSLSDVGTYRTGPVLAAGGGRFTINPADPKTPTNWQELVAAQLGLSASACAARNGGFGTTETTVAGCRNYAQGGARVTNPKGVGNPVGVGFTAGALTEPVVTQIAHFVTDNGSANFTGKELVTVLAGANDIFGLTDQLTADATAVGNTTFAQSLVGGLVAGAPTAYQAAAAQAIGLAVQTEAAKPGSTANTIVTAAATAAATHAAMNGYTNTAVANVASIAAAAGTAATAAGNSYAGTTGAGIAVAGMVTAATELAGYVKNRMIGMGAKYVVVVNLPDVSLTPSAKATPANQPLVLAMTTAFNNALQTGLAGTAGVIIVDAFHNLQDEVNHPEQYSLSNVTGMACDLAKVNNTSLFCSAATLIAGDTSHYLFADGVHPTPYGYKLLGQLVSRDLAKAGWL